MPRYGAGFARTASFGPSAYIHIGQDSRVFMPMKGIKDSGVFTKHAMSRFYTQILRVRDMLKTILNSCEFTDNEVLFQMIHTYPPVFSESDYQTNEQKAHISGLKDGSITIDELAATENFLYAEICFKLAVRSDPMQRLDSIQSQMLGLDVDLCYPFVAILNSLKHLNNDEHTCSNVLDTILEYQSILVYVKYVMANVKKKEKLYPLEIISKIALKICPNMPAQRGRMFAEAIINILEEHKTNKVNDFFLSVYHLPKSPIKAIFFASCMLFRAYHFKYLDLQLEGFLLEDANNTELTIKTFYHECLCEVILMMKEELNKAAMLQIEK